MQQEKFDQWAIVEGEEWRPIAEYEGLYEISNLGRVKRVGRSAITGKGHGGGARVMMKVFLLSLIKKVH